ncbi:gluconokinase [Sandarakinorhabdus sp. DWP1-3-1]|uniref:gluconokinase n=1 Tax=Sandarakinorhabdus sp. DWP1-3-1 TaxID=2804627 RepID=UPI003CF36BA6
MILPHSLVLCGVAGAGKTRLATALARQLGVPLQEGDDLHPPANVARMAAGTPLDDADRAPWLDAIAAVIAGWHAADTPGIVTCSALKRAYRDRLRAAGPIGFVFLAIDADLARARLGARAGHFMPATLVASQFAALEVPAAEADVLTLPADLDTATQVAAVLAALADPPVSPSPPARGARA